MGSKNLASLRITIPDAPPKKQLKMVKDWIFIIDTMGKLTGEDVEITKKPLLEIMSKLDKEIKNGS